MKIALLAGLVLLVVMERKVKAKMQTGVQGTIRCYESI